MEVIPQQAIRKSIRNRVDVLCIQPHKMLIIALLNKDILAVCPAIVDVVVGVVK